MEIFIARANIARFKAMLLAEDDFIRQQMLHELLAAEEAKLVALEKAAATRPRAARFHEILALGGPPSAAGSS
jgi:hypothetical protein